MTIYESAFERLHEEWNDLVVGERASAVATWNVSFAKVESEYQLLVRTGRWLEGRDDLLGVIGASRRETYHSAVLAWLLTPTRRHGLGAAFLHLLLSRLRIEADRTRLHRVRVGCEVARLETRADIVVWGTDFTIVIENKVDAGEQPSQCERLHDRFCEEISPVFIYLTPTKASPRTTGRAAVAERFKTLSYLDVIADLDTVLRDTSVSAVHDYRSTLSKEFE